MSEQLSGAEVIRRAAGDLPGSSGVYRMLGADGAALYIGKAKVLKNRVAQYANVGALPLRLQRMVMATRSVAVTLTASEAEALLLEANLVKQLQPKYNILLRDDKSYPYIHISPPPYPRISKYRGSRKEPGEYFGPFVSAHAVDEMVTLLQRAFLLRPCADSVFKNRTRPCLQYQIKRCSAPCVRYVGEAEYANLVSQAKQFLRGRDTAILSLLEADMQAASEGMDYERAAGLRDRIKALASVQRQAGSGREVEDADAVAIARLGGAACVYVSRHREGRDYGGKAYFPLMAEEASDAEVLSAFLGQFYQGSVPPRQVMVSAAPEGADVLAEALSQLAGRKVEIYVPERGAKRGALAQAMRNAASSLERHLAEAGRQGELREKVAALFGLDAPPERIEVYDNSHVSGTDAVGAMIVSGAEGFEKKSYRLFNIKGEALTPGDDYAMLREVLSRRFRLWNELSDSRPAPRPDLLLIDGGAGHLRAAEDVLVQLGVTGVPLAAISKGRDRNAGREWFHLPGREPFQLPVNDAVLHYLQRLRDEAHRFAIGAHRNRRSKGMRVSELDAIEGIGPARKKALLKYFGSSREVGAASVEEIAQAPGVSRALAEKIYAHFHG